MIISSGAVGEAKKPSLKEPIRDDLWSSVEWGILVARGGPMLVKNSLNLLAINSVTYVVLHGSSPITGMFRRDNGFK